MMIESVRNYIIRNKLLQKEDTVLIGVSGGPDSMALLHILNSLQGEYGLRLHVAHLNHMFRGEEAQADAEFVASFCQTLQVPYTIGKEDVPAFIKKTGLSTQEAARDLRYGFFSRTALTIRATKIALGHHADDQAETIMFNLLRGSGMKGLAGMRPQRELYIRPLLGVTRAEIEKYIWEHNLPTRLDPTNLQTVYTRNHIRLELLPLLKKMYNPNLIHNLNQMAEILRVENDYLDNITSEIFLANVQTKPGQVAISKHFLMSLPLALRRRVLMRMYQALAGQESTINFKTVALMEAFLEQQATQKKLGLPQEIVLKIKAGTIIISKPQPFAISKDFQVTLTVPGQANLPNQQILAAEVFTTPSSWEGYKQASSSKAYLDMDRVELPLVVRSRRPGDVFIPLGLKGKKKIKDFFIDYKVPPEKRSSVPVVTDSTGKILWLGGYRIDERCKITATTNKVLVLSLKPRP